MNKIVCQDVDFFVKHFLFEEEIKKTKIAITGATGLIGSTIIRCLLALNGEKSCEIKIVGFVRNTDKAKSLFPNANIKWISYDLAKPCEIKELNIDYIFHCACPTSSKFYVENPVELIKTSIQGSISILDYAVKNTVKGIVYLSSCEVYGSVDTDSVIDESYSGYVNPIDVRSGYPMAKRLVECLCHSYSREYGVPVTIARLTQTFGAGVALSDNRVFAQFSKSAIMNKDIIMHTKGYSAKPYCYTIDAINAFFYLIFKGKSGEAYNITNSETYISICQLAEYIANNYSDYSKVIIEEKEGLGYAPVTKLHMSTKKVEALGWEPWYSMDQMFTNLINYYKSEINS